MYKSVNGVIDVATVDDDCAISEASSAVKSIDPIVREVG